MKLDRAVSPETGDACTTCFVRRAPLPTRPCIGTVGGSRTPPRVPPDMRRSITALPVAKLRRPPIRDGLVSRARLTRRLVGSSDLPLALLVAPAGYGKTTLLCQWAEQDRRPFAWVTLDEDDNDPLELLA